MKLIPTDPSLQTLMTMLGDGDINLQPEFQRGEVWGVQKKKRLIDTVLRDWHIPPIHVIKIEETGELEVLDGQQRLAAIRDFFSGKLTVDGHISPHDVNILNLDGAKYNDLPEKLARRVKQFAIRMFTVESYSPEEPGELFYRLNQPTNLTAAEHRNAYYGMARQQIKSLVKHMKILGISKDNIGFSNARMAYDDVLAKFCYSLEAGTLSEKVTSNAVTEMFRTNNKFSESTISIANNSLELLSSAVVQHNPKIKFNKATLHSWLCFFSTLISERIDYEKIGLLYFVSSFEKAREAIKKSNSPKKAIFKSNGLNLPSDVFFQLFKIFNDRSSSRVADVSSVLLRDFVLCYSFYKVGAESNVSIRFNCDRMRSIDYFEHSISNLENSTTEHFLTNILDSLDWGYMA